MTTENIITAVEKASGISRDDILSQSRLMEFTAPRHALRCLLREHLNITLESTAKITGGSASAVIYSLSLSDHKEVAQIIELANAKLSGSCCPTCKRPF